jgi:uncharacterized protein (DUF885 family)
MSILSFALSVIVIATLPVAALAAPVDTNFDRRLEDLFDRGRGMSDSARMHALFEMVDDYNMFEYPEWATYEGYNDRNGLWTDISDEATERRRKTIRRRRDLMLTIDREKLSAVDRLNYDLFLRGIEQSIAGEKFPGELMPINQLGGIQQEVPTLFEVMPRASVKDFENILSRMRGIPPRIELTMERMEKGRRAGITPPQVTLRDIPGQVEALLRDDPFDSPVMLPFRTKPATIDSVEWKRIRRQSVELYTRQVAPAFRRLHGYLVETYIPGARKSIGMGAMPGGKEWYAYEANSSTTTTLTPAEIHRLGLSEVKRIRAEMEKVIAATGFKGNFSEFVQFLRTDPRFFHTDSASLVEEYRAIAKRADPELVKLFGRLPRLPYGVTPVPTFAQKSQTTAYYQPGSARAGRPGNYYVNTYDLSSRPRWEMEALTLHEAVPGHHLQISIAQELEDLPRFRRDGFYTAYVEGWALYAESLGTDMGFYSDPYSKFGQLSYEMWRAIRLVVDTGIHSEGWSREDAIKYFQENSSKTEHDIIVEVDRYIVWPGQALAYKIGELKIRELRDFARAELGEAFDIRAFHDLILGSGALPLDVLDRQVHQWVAGLKRNPETGSSPSKK